MLPCEACHGEVALHQFGEELGDTATQVREDLVLQPVAQLAEQEAGYA